MASTAGAVAVPQRLRDRARHVQGPHATLCFAHHRPRKRGNAPRVATSIDLASEVRSANPELRERNENFPIVPLGTSCTIWYRQPSMTVFY